MTVLLLGADYYGTLAAARCYGRQGIAVTMADESRRARALHSKYVTRRLVHPPLADPDGLVAWLVRWGEQHPGAFLYPPNDHLAWLFALRREDLAPVFAMYGPSERAVIALLDKKRLHDACAEVGIDVPRTALPDAGAFDPSDIEFPVLVKPRTQVFLVSGIKGFIAHDREDLALELSRFRELVAFNPVLTARHPDVAQPMVQEYLPAAETSIFSVSGFVAADGTFACRSAMKVLQRPRKVGIGLCFENRHDDEGLAEKLSRLCRAVGYFGAFEAEFIVSGDRRLLIDFNPRFYSQMAFDIARGLPIPLLVYYAARNDAPGLADAIARARTWRGSGTEVYCHKTMLDVVLTLQRLSGQMSRGDVRRWRRWYRDHASGVTDAVRDPADPLPALVDAASWATHFARHPRSFVKSFVLNE
jgi:D-aspartate ligase